MAFSLESLPRKRVCLECRTALLEGEACDGGPNHRVADLTEPNGRTALVNEVWGPPSSRRRMREAARAGSAGAGAGGLGQALDCGGCTGCGDIGGAGGELLAVIAVILVAAIVAVVLYFAISALVRYIQKKRSEPRAKGALVPARPFAGPAVAGKVAGLAELAAPMVGVRCVAFAAELTKRRRDVMLRDAVTCGFDVTLGDGRIVRVPPGRLRLEGAPEQRVKERIDVETYVESIDRESRSIEELAPIPFDLATIATLRPGDEVEIVGNLATVADPSGSHGYREAAMTLAPTGVPRIRVIAASERAESS